MEKTKLKHRNAPSTVYAIGVLAETAIQRDSGNLKSVGAEHPEISTLRDKCKDDDLVTSTSACAALVALVESGVITIPNTLSTFIAILPYCSNHIGITSAIAQLMILDLKMRIGPEKKYKSPFNLQSPQHPLLTVLKQNQESWLHVVSQISHLCKHEDEIIKINSCELVRPLVLYMMCAPRGQNLSPLIYQQQLWSILLSLDDTALLEICFPWLQMNDIQSVQPLLLQLSMCVILKHQTEDSILSVSNVCLQISNLAYCLISRGEDPRLILNTLDQLVTECSTFTGSCVAMMLAHSISKSPAIYLSSLIAIGLKLIKQENCTLLSGKMLVASLLPWLAHPSILTAKALREAQTILDEVDSLAGVIMSTVPFTSHSCSLAHLCVQTCLVSNSWSSSDYTDVVEWLKKLHDTPLKFKADHSLLVGALIIQSSTTSTLLSECLSVLLSLTDELPELGTSVLTWLLFRLAREVDPNNQIQLLRSLPLMGSQKDNVTLVIHTLESLKSSIPMRPIVLNLYLRLWHREARCFSYLHKLISEEFIDRSASVLSLQWDIARAATMKEICETRPSQHGKDLVPLLSNILNTCTNIDGAVASSLSLQAISALCKAKIVDVATTWKTLAPRFSKDMRIPVVKSICDILGLMSEVRTSYPDQPKLLAEAQFKLWQYVEKGGNPEIQEAALLGLSKFSLDQLSLKIMPAPYRQNLKLPLEFAKTPIDAARKPEDVLPYIPHECWPQLLAAIPSAVILTKVLLTEEVASMRGALHRAPGRAEPDLPSLPQSSVCLGLISHARTNADRVDSSVVACLETLVTPLPQVLPPCNWSFLSTLAKHKQCHLLCLNIAATQAPSSPSAHLVAENLIKSLSSTEQGDVLYGFSLLDKLCRGVSPKTLRPFIETALQASMKDSTDISIFETLMGHMKRALQNNLIHEANRNLLCIILEGLLEQLSIDEKFFSSYVETIGELPNKYLERMSSPSVWWEITQVKLQKSIAIRSYIATQSDIDAPLVWMNECIDAATTSPREQDFLLSKLYGVLIFSRKKSSNQNWLLELMGHVQAALTSTDKQAEASFLCDIFSLAVLVFSGHDCLSCKSVEVSESREKRLSLLPQALFGLLSLSNWQSITAQVIEWLHHLILSPVIDSYMTEQFYKSLQALRSTGPMQQLGVWQRIVSV